jgi:hypothetical protein
VDVHLVARSATLSNVFARVSIMDALEPALAEVTVKTLSENKHQALQNRKVCDCESALVTHSRIRCTSRLCACVLQKQLENQR